MEFDFKIIKDLDICSYMVIGNTFYIPETMLTNEFALLLENHRKMLELIQTPKQAADRQELPLCQ